MIQVNSSTLSPQDYEYFKTNFKVKAATVSSLEEADIILLGERHTAFEHKMKELWLINKLAKAGDTLFLETGHKLNIKVKYFSTIHAIFFHGYRLTAPVTVDGWDSLKDRLKFNKLISKINSILDRIEAITKASSTFPADSMIKKDIATLQTVIADQLFKNKSINAKQYKLSLLKDLNPDILKTPEIYADFQNELDAKVTEHIKKYEDFKATCQQAQSASGINLKVLAVETLSDSIKLIQQYDSHQDYINFVNRNIALSENITRPLPAGKKAWVIAGKAHLICKKHSFEYKAGIDYLQRKLKDKKYIVLFPTKSGYLTNIKEHLISPILRIMRICEAMWLNLKNITIWAAAFAVNFIAEIFFKSPIVNVAIQLTTTLLASFSLFYQQTLKKNLVNLATESGHTDASRIFDRIRKLNNINLLRIKEIRAEINKLRPQPQSHEAPGMLHLETAVAHRKTCM